MTMALWSELGTSKTLNSSTSSPRTKPWSMRNSLGMPGQGDQVGESGESLEPRLRATATAASVNWDAVRRYNGQMGVALKSPISTLGEDDLAACASAEEAPACFEKSAAPHASQRSTDAPAAAELAPPRAA